MEVEDTLVLSGMLNQEDSLHCKPTSTKHAIVFI